MNYVLLGSDSRDPDNAGAGRSDTIMVVHLNTKRNQAYIISFPRDMYVDIPGYGKNKINAAYSFGGVPLTVRTLESLTGTRMDHVVLVDFEGFIAADRGPARGHRRSTTTRSPPTVRLPQGRDHDRRRAGPVVRPGAQAAAQRRPRPGRRTSAT